MENSPENAQNLEALSKIYYLPDNIIRKVDNRGMSRELSDAIVLKAVSKPMTYKELQKQTGFQKMKIVNCVNDLVTQGKLLRFRIHGNQSVGAYNCRRLFGDLTNRFCVYKNGQEEGVAKCIIKRLPLEEIVKSTSMHKSVSQRLGECLPPELYQIVRSNYNRTCDSLKSGAHDSR